MVYIIMFNYRNWARNVILRAATSRKYINIFGKRLILENRTQIEWWTKRDDIEEMVYVLTVHSAYALDANQVFDTQLFWWCFEGDKKCYFLHYRRKMSDRPTSTWTSFSIILYVNKVKKWQKYTKLMNGRKEFISLTP